MAAHRLAVQDGPADRTELADEARAYFDGQADAIVPGDAPGGAPSTVLDATGPTLRVLRQGAIKLQLG